MYQCNIYYHDIVSMIMIFFFSANNYKQNTLFSVVSMPVLEEHYSCFHCNFSSAKKNGFYKWMQRYRCLRCKKSFTDWARNYNFEDKEEAIEKYKDNKSMRQTAKEMWISQDTVKRWLVESKK